MFWHSVIYGTESDTFETLEWGRTQKGKTCGRYFIHIHSLVIQFTASAFESQTKCQSGEWQAATRVAGPAHLHAQRGPVTAQSFLSTSGTFLPLGQSCVYFQGAVFFPGPSWPLSEGFWQRSTFHKRPGHSSCLSLIPSVSSC